MFSSLLHTASKFSSCWDLDLVDYGIFKHPLSAHPMFCLNQLLSVVSSWFTAQEGYFMSDNQLKQVEHAINIFESKTNGVATGLFLFDNAPSHQKKAADALSAHRIPKAPCANWTHHKNGLKMQKAIYANRDPQSLYYPYNHPTIPEWLKGMEMLIHE